VEKIELTFYFWIHVAKLKAVDSSPLPVWSPLSQNAVKNLVKTGTTHKCPKAQKGKKFKKM
jgi:hypothetical protein